MNHLNSLHQSKNYPKFHFELPRIFAQFELIVVFSPALCFYHECQPATARSDGRGKRQRRTEAGAEIVEKRHNWRHERREADTRQNY